MSRPTQHLVFSRRSTARSSLSTPPQPSAPHYFSPGACAPRAPATPLLFFAQRSQRRARIAYIRYGVGIATRPRVKEQKSINVLSSPSVRTIIVARASSRRVRQCTWRLQSMPLSLTARSFSLTDLAGPSTSRRRRPGKVTEHSCSHATMSSNGDAALLTMPGHRGPPAMSAEAAGELEESRGSARGGHPHSIA